MTGKFGRRFDLPQVMPGLGGGKPAKRRFDLSQYPQFHASYHF
jgi:hypothetical protein